jgi:hypothetical protein
MGKKLPISTTGYNADYKFIKYLTKKYPDTFRVHLSIITFDRAIRRKLMHPNIDLENLKRIATTLIRPVYFLLPLTKEQSIEDIGLLNDASIMRRGTIYLHKLYYNKLSPKYIIDYANRAERHFKDIIYFLKQNDKKLGNISERMIFSPSSKIYAWSWKRDIKKLLKGCTNDDDEAIFCSAGAAEIIKSSVGKKSHVIPVKSCFGGSVDFTLGMTVKEVLRGIGRVLDSGATLKRIYIPDSMFCVESKFDLNCDSVDLIHKRHRKIKVRVVRIPSHILMSNLNLNSCFRYYEQKSR